VPIIWTMLINNMLNYHISANAGLVCFVIGDRTAARSMSVCLWRSALWLLKR